MIKRGAVVGGAYPDNISFPSPERRAEFEAYLKDRQQSSFAMSPSEVRYAIAKHRGDMRAAQDASNAEYLERATRKQNETLRAFGQAALVVGGTLAAAKIVQSNTPPSAIRALPSVQPSASSGAVATAPASGNASPAAVGTFQDGGNMSAGLSSPKSSYVSESDRGFFGRGSSEAEGCTKANSELERGPYLAVKVLDYKTTGPCACKHIHEPGFGAARPAIDYYDCTIPAVVRIETDTDPKVGRQPGPSSGRVQ